MNNKILICSICFAVAACRSSPPVEEPPISQKETIDFPELLVFDSSFYHYFPGNHDIEIVADNLYFPEAPIWSDDLNGLLFSDVPADRIYHWNHTDGLSVWLEPSGYTNGLIINSQGDLLLLQGNSASIDRATRQIGVISNPESDRTIKRLTQHFEGKNFNSPNDIAMDKKGALYFTDPPYGLVFGDIDTLKELPFNGVFALRDGNVELLIDSIDRPNGIALSPDDRYLYITDSEQGRLLTYELNDHGEITGMVNFFSTREIEKHASFSSMPFFNGLSVSKRGVLLLSGYNGVWFVSPEGKLMAHVQTPEFASNNTLDSEETYLYWTAARYPYTPGSGSVGRMRLRD